MENNNKKKNKEKRPELHAFKEASACVHEGVFALIDVRP